MAIICYHRPSMPRIIKAMHRGILLGISDCQVTPGKVKPKAIFFLETFANFDQKLPKTA